MKETKKLILDVAKRLFSKYGLRKTTVDEIAKEARIGKGTIYHYYESKEAIFFDVVENEVEALKGGITEAVDSAQKADEKLKAYMVTRMRLFNKFANFYSTFKEEYIEYYGFVNRIHEKYNDFEITRIGDIIKDGIKSGIFSVENPALTAFALLVTMKGMEYYWALEPEEVVEKKINSMLTVLFNGMLKR
jgi:AcrR family transcriptional regulator